MNYNMKVVVSFSEDTRQSLKQDLESMERVFDYLWRICPEEGNLDMLAHDETVYLIRRGMWERYHQFRTHFLPLDATTWKSTNGFIFTGHSYAIQKYGDQWYLVSVLKDDEMNLILDRPENYPGNVFPKGICKADYPEILIAKFLLNDCQPWKVH